MSIWENIHVILFILNIIFICILTLTMYVILNVNGRKLPNITGPGGPTGPTGIRGGIYDYGNTGPTGIKGEKGNDNNTPGPTGYVGDDGSKGNSNVKNYSSSLFFNTIKPSIVETSKKSITCSSQKVYRGSEDKISSSTCIGNISNVNCSYNTISSPTCSSVPTITINQDESLYPGSEFYIDTRLSNYGYITSSYYNNISTGEKLLIENLTNSRVYRFILLSDNVTLAVSFSCSGGTKDCN